MVSDPTGLPVDRGPGKWMGTNYELGACLMLAYCGYLGYIRSGGLITLLIITPSTNTVLRICVQFLTNISMVR
jgi:hypothetical protein